MTDARYELLKTDAFDEWYRYLPGKKMAAVNARLALAAAGVFVHSKPLGQGLFEFKWNDGMRVYFSRRKVAGADVLVLVGGDKSTQDRDIRRARKLKELIEEDDLYETDD